MIRALLPLPFVGIFLVVLTILIAIVPLIPTIIIAFTMVTVVAAIVFFWWPESLTIAIAVTLAPATTIVITFITWLAVVSPSDGVFVGTVTRLPVPLALFFDCCLKGVLGAVTSEPLGVVGGLGGSDLCF